MLKIDVLIDLFFTGESWGKRAEQIAACGYEYIETWQGADTAALKEMNSAGVKLISIVMNSFHHKETIPINPANQAAFVAHIDKMADSALAAGCTQGIVTAGQQVGGMSYHAQRTALVEALAAAAAKVSDRNFSLNLEPLNTEVDHAGYHLSSALDSVAIVKETGCKNLKVLYDIYHMTIMSGNQTEFLRHNLDWIGHFHIAAVPGRHEPEHGETNYPFLLQEIAKGGYQNFLGLEYIPLLPSRESLLQTARYLKSGV